MKRYKYVFLGLMLIVGLQNILAQQINFEPILPPQGNGLVAPFCQLNSSTVNFVDIDGDNSLDVLLTGSSKYNTYTTRPFTKLYKNDGYGNFSEWYNTGLPNVKNAMIDFADIDGDNNQDVLIIGTFHAGEYWPRLAKLYKNDGNGNFSLVGGTSLPTYENGSVDFADIDGDNDVDLLITGEHEVKLYTNNGNGIFGLISGTPFVGVSDSDAQFVDIDNDSDLDLIISGNESYNTELTRIYINDGNGNYTEALGSPLIGAYTVSIACADIDGDNDMDLLISGKNQNLGKITRLFTNDGSGIFTETTNSVFQDIKGTVAFADIDGDNDPDLLISGTNTYTTPGTTKFYINDGAGNFTEISTTLFPHFFNSAIAFADVDNDNDNDLIISGKPDILGQDVFSKLYVNDGTGNFTEAASHYLENVSLGTVDFIDVDGDNDKDILLTGEVGYNNITSGLYINDGNNYYTAYPANPFPQVKYSAVDYADIDGDSDLDVFITGATSLGYSDVLSKLFINDGTGNFSLSSTNFDNVKYGSVDFADVDGDNDQDLLVTGVNDSYQTVAHLYFNLGNENFVELNAMPFMAVMASEAEFEDVDADGDLDVLISGKIHDYNSTNARFAKLYLNDGQGNFTEKTGEPFMGVSNCSIAFGDIDADRDSDVLITGYYYNDNCNCLVSSTKLYTNDGMGNYTEIQTPVLKDVAGGTVAFIDIDADNDLDIFLSGEYYHNEEKYYAGYYLNDGTGNFTEIGNHTIIPVSFNDADFADIDNDGDVDLILAGIRRCQQNLTSIYENKTDVSPAIYINSPVNNELLSPETVNLNIDFSVYGFSVANASGDGHIRYSLNGGTPVDKYDLSPVNLSGLMPGTYSFTIELVDQNGNPLPTPVADTIEFDIATYTSVSNLLELKTANTREYYQLDNEIFITAQQTFTSGNTIIFAQDETAGMKILLPYNINVNNYNRYDGISNLKGKLINNNGVLQLNLTNAFTVTGNNQVQQPQIINIVDYQNNPLEYMSELVKVENLSINPEDDLVFKLQEQYMITDANSQFPLKVFFWNLAGEYIPTDLVNITGIASIDITQENILPRDISDFEEANAIEMNEITAVKIYPNPATNIIFIDVDEPILKTEIFDVSGKNIYQGNNHKVNISQLPSGLYMLKVYMKQNSVIKKFIKY